MRVSTLLLLVFFGLIVFSGTPVRAEDNVLEYTNTPVLDNDLDGLTNLGEEKIFKTNPNFPDSDNDGFFDGTEIIGNSNPLDDLSPTATEKFTSLTYPLPSENAWGWYATRAFGIIAFFLLYLSIFLGVIPRIPFARKWFLPLCNLRIHGWVSLQSLIFAIIHASSLLFEKYFEFSLAEIFIPFVSPDFAFSLFSGQLSLFLMFSMVLSSYFMRFIPLKVWRGIHFSNLILFFVIIFHSLSFGTDFKEGTWARDVFIGMNIFLFCLMLINMFFRLANALRRKISDQA